jgi:aspartyl-tRNA(Asn)/glutamyl-tRNA(Gln) amidotransferase subunit A
MIAPDNDKTGQDEISHLSVWDLSGFLESGQLLASEITEAFIRRIEEKNPSYQAFLTTSFDQAIESARQADDRQVKKQRRGPIDGIPVALKDAYDTRGLRTTVGSGLFADRVPAADSAVWEKLQESGAVLLGKLNCTEFCLGGPSPDVAYPTSLNPHDTRRYTGGSSSGAGVALATGMVPAAMGSDTGGSIRIPAAFCGVAGIKPTYGLVSLRGLFPLSGSLDHAGPMARTSRDCAMLLDAIMGYDPAHPSSSKKQIAATTPGLSENCQGVVIGYVSNFSEAEGVTEESRAACLRALDVFSVLGAKIKHVSLPSLWDFTIANTTIMTAEAYAIHKDRFRNNLDKISNLTRHRISLGAFFTAEDYIKAQKARRVLTSQTYQLMAEHGLDLLCYPAMLGDPPEIDKVSPYYYLEAPLITAPANITGAPAASVRAGFSAANMPMAFQLTGRLYGDGKVLAAAHAFEMATAEFSKIME